MPVGGKTASLVVIVAVMAPLAGGAPVARAQEPAPDGESEQRSARSTPDEAHACVAAYETAQVMQQNDHLTEAREALRFCARPVCPAVASVDCLRWLGDVERAMPSIVLEARLGEREVTQVAVALDGKEVLQQLDGKAFEVDPGPHRLSFTLPGQRPTETMIVARTGEKNRRVLVRLDTALEALRSIAPQGGTAPEGGASSRRRAGWIVGGIGLVSLVTGGAFGVHAITENNASNDVCPSRRCADSSALAANGEARTAAWISDVTVGVGLLGLAVGGYLVLTSPARTTPVRLEPYVSGAQSGLRLTGGW